jgi:hypothetical protein
MQPDQSMALYWAMAREAKGLGLMPIIAAQSLADSRRRTQICADLALTAAKRGERVLALDLCPDRQLSRDLVAGGFANAGDVRRIFKPGGAIERYVPYPRLAVLAIGGCFFDDHTGNDLVGAEPLFDDPAAAQQALLTYFTHLRDKIDLCFIDCPPDAVLQGLLTWMTIEVHFVEEPQREADFARWKKLVLDIFPADLQPRVIVERRQN